MLASTGAAAILGLPELTSSAWAQSSDALQDAIIEIISTLVEIAVIAAVA